MSDLCCGQYPLPNFKEIADQLYILYMHGSHRIKYHPTERMFVDYVTNKVINDNSLIYKEYTINKCFNEQSSMNNRLCFTGEDQWVAAENHCNLICCKHDCMTVMKENSHKEMCWVNALGVEVCTYTAIVATNFYCCTI